MTKRLLSAIAWRWPSQSRSRPAAARRRQLQLRLVRSPLVGAGSTLVAPLMSKWQPDYAEQVRRNGHLRGDRQRRRDRPDHLAHGRLRRLRRAADREQFEAAKGVEQIPWALSGTVPAYNVSGAPEHLKLSGEVLADIYLGKITSWDDPAIAKLNPGASLPSTKITPVYRSDGSGDTYAFTNYLSTISPEFKSKVGTSTEVKFPTGVGAEKNDGVAAAISQTDGAIGYVGLAYALSNELSMPLVENSAGNFPEPGVESVEAAAAAVKQDPERQLDLAGRPAGFGQGRLPDLDLHLRDRAARNRQGGRAEEVHHLRDRSRARNSAPISTSRRCRKQVVAAGKKAIAKIGS